MGNVNPRIKRAFSGVSEKTSHMRHITPAVSGGNAKLTVLGPMPPPFAILTPIRMHSAMMSTTSDRRIRGALADAKASMERKPGCQDVFVTQSGGPDQPVLGWLTNTRIQRLSQA